MQQYFFHHGDTEDTECTPILDVIPDQIGNPGFLSTRIQIEKPIADRDSQPGFTRILTPSFPRKRESKFLHHERHEGFPPETKNDQPMTFSSLIPDPCSPTADKRR
jgi:hypothetical protein